MRLFIWTLMKNSPFILGGDCNKWHPTGCIVDVTGPFDIGKGIKVFKAASPFYTEHFIDAESGGIIGDDLEQVKRDVEAADPKVMKQQIKEAKEQASKALKISPDKFWANLKTRYYPGDKVAQKVSEANG